MWSIILEGELTFEKETRLTKKSTLEGSENNWKLFLIYFRTRLYPGTAIELNAGISKSRCELCYFGVKCIS